LNLPTNLGSATVAATVAALGAAADGKLGFIVTGGFTVPLIYSSTIGKWISPEFPVSMAGHPSRNGQGGRPDETLNLLTDRHPSAMRYRELHVAGLRLQTNTIVTMTGTDPQAANYQSMMGFFNAGAGGPDTLVLRPGGAALVQSPSTATWTGTTGWIDFI